MGCGKGVFTYALAEFLAKGSKIYAIDRSSQNLRNNYEGVEIEFLKADFEKDPMPLKSLNGILMANSFHYVKDKVSCIRKLENYLASQKKFLIIEYDRTRSNPWVPYPVDFAGLKEIFITLGYKKIEKLSTQRSAFGGMVYSALIEQ